MNAKEPTAEEIREAMDFAIASDMKGRWDHVYAHVRDLLLADPDRVRVLLALTRQDLLAARNWNDVCGMPKERITRAIDLHPDAKGGAE